MLSKLSKQLQEHPLIVLSMFILSALSAIVTLALGWNDFYIDYLSKTVSLPVWLIFLLLIITPIIWFSTKKDSTSKKLEEYEIIEGKQFGVQQIKLDGRTFKRCHFSASELIFEGENGFNFEHNSFDAPRFTFSGAASNTLAMMTAMYKDPTFKPLIDCTLNNIRQGMMPEAVPENPDA